MYKVGDKIRLLKSASGRWDRKFQVIANDREVGTITSIDGIKHYSSFGAWFYANQIEKVQKKPTIII